MCVCVLLWICKVEINEEISSIVKKKISNYVESPFEVITFLIESK